MIKQRKYSAGLINRYGGRNPKQYS